MLVVAVGDFEVVVVGDFAAAVVGDFTMVDGGMGLVDATFVMSDDGAVLDSGSAMVGSDVESAVDTGEVSFSIFIDLSYSFLAFIDI